MDHGEDDDVYHFLNFSPMHPRKEQKSYLLRVRSFSLSSLSFLLLSLFVSSVG